MVEEMKLSVGASAQTDARIKFFAIFIWNQAQFFSLNCVLIYGYINTPFWFRVVLFSCVSMIYNKKLNMCNKNGS